MTKKTTLFINIIFVTVILVFFAVAKIMTDRASDTSEQIRDDIIILEPDREISALYERDGRVYVGTDKGVGIYDEDTLQCVSRIGDLNLIYSAGITGTPDGCIFIGHEKGLTCIYPDGSREEFSHPDIPDGRVNTVCFDGENIWCGTYDGAAVLRLSDGKWSIDRLLSSKTGLICDSVNAILPVGDDMIIGSYLETDHGGISVLYEDGQIDYIGISEGLPHPYVTSLAALGNGTVLVGCGYMTDGGLAVLKKDNGSYRISGTYTKDDGLPGEKIRSIYTDDRCVIISTEYDGVEIIDLKNTENGSVEQFEDNDLKNGTYLREENGLSNNEIKCIIRAGDYYWMGSKYGLDLIPVQ